MKILIVEDEAISLEALRLKAIDWGYSVETAMDGAEAWSALHEEDPANILILDLMIPEMDGITLTNKLRAERPKHPLYVIILTARSTKKDKVQGLLAGADDYLTKPFDAEELQARLKVAERVIGLQRELGDRVLQLEQALSQVKQLEGMLPICSYCKRVRDDQNYWHQIEEYVTHHSQALFSHSICPECYDMFVKSNAR
jgi:phosphoserine phosphatase RsbU/P